MKKLLFLTLVFCFLATPYLFSQVTSSGSDNIRMFLDFARFRYDENNTYLEIYYLLYDMSTDSLSGADDVWLEFFLLDKNKDSLLAKSNLKVSMDGNNANNHNGNRVQGSLIKTVLPTGKYEIKMVRLGQNGNQKLDSLNHVFSTPHFKADKISLSDLELCSNIVTNSTNEKGLFYKNTLEVFPNPMRMYNEQTPNLHYYIEIYNLKSENQGDEVKIEVAIANKDGKIEAQKSYTQKRNYESLVEFGSFDVSEFSSGLYTLIFAVTDLTANYSYYTRSNFYVMNITELTVEQEGMMAAFSGSEFIMLSEQELNEKIEQAMYIATEEEKRMSQALDNIESKRMFLFRFWYERERTGYEGLENEFYERVDYANEHYRFANRDGWESDRGRIYIVYGKPDEIDRHPQNPDSRPYVIWTYHNLEGGAKFLFVDMSGFGDYKLVTSTLRGEIYNAGWDDLLYKP